MLYKIVKTKFDRVSNFVHVSNIKEGVLTKADLDINGNCHDVEMKFAVISLLGVRADDITILDTMETKRGYIFAVLIGGIKNED